MSKSGMNNAPMKQEHSPYKKDNRGQHTPGDKRASGNFGKNERPSPNPMNNNRDRERRERNEHNEFENNDTTEKDKDAPLGEKKFTGRCRLFVGNLTPDVTEADFRKMFETYGEISEVYVNTQRGFGFIRLDYRQNAEAAKAALDGIQRKGRILRVRFATHGAALKVKNLHSHVSNELLEQSFSQFGELERCIVIVDDRGKSTGEGIVEFVRKPGANSALRRITEGVFLMGVDPKPVSVEPLEQKDEEDGMPEKFLTKTDQYKKEREKEPRFAPPGTFEYEFGMRWKQLDDLEKQRIEQVKKDTEKARLELEEEMQNALYDYQAEQIRQDLMRQQEELRRLEELRNSERLRRQQEMELRRQKEEREMAQQEERRREMMMNVSRQQDLARGRSGPMDGPGMRSRDEMMMAERFGDRMGDRMGDRIPDRMGDRMGQGGPGFNMWKEEQQRNEAGMKGMRGNDQPPNRGGRGDMRGGPPGSQPPMPGGPGPQGPGGPQGGMDRGGPAGPGSGSGASGPAGGQNKDGPGPKPLMQPGSGFNAGGPGNNGPPNNSNAGNDGNNMDTGCNGESSPNQECLEKRYDDGEHQIDSSSNNVEMCSTAVEPQSPSINSENSEGIPKPPWKEENDDQKSHSRISTSVSDSIASEDITGDKCTQDEILQEDMDISISWPVNNCVVDEVCDDSDMHPSTCDKRYEPSIFVGHEDCRSTQISKLEESPETLCPFSYKHQSDKEVYTKNSMKIDICCSCVTDSQNVKSLCEGDNAKDENDASIKHDQPLNTKECIVPYNRNEMVDNNHSPKHSSPNAESLNAHHPVTSFTVTSSTSNCENVMNYQTTSFSKENGLIPSSNTDNYCADTKNILTLSKSNDCANAITNDETVPHSSNHSANGSSCSSSSSSSNCTAEGIVYNQDQGLYEDCEYDPNIQSREPEDYCSSNYVSSYKQDLSGHSEEMDTDRLVENCDSELMRTADSNIYQSYETGHFIPIIGTEENCSNVFCPETSTSSSNDHSVTAVSVSNEQTAPPLPSSDKSAEVNSISNDEVFRTGDQSFKTEASREAALASVISVPSSGTTSLSSESFPASSGLNQSSMMSSSTMHIAQHQGGATFMQTQTMRAGLNGGVAQATVLQKQALPNGGQAVVQQRTITNGGQTMMVQQHMMTNGLGGITQQTVVQQRVIPTSMTRHAQAAVLHASALRQHAMATQQAARASALQQQGIRVQAVVGNSVYQTPTLARRTAVLHRAAGSSMLGPRLVQAPTTTQGSMMQRLVRQRYLGGPVLHPARGVQMLAGRPIRVKMAYSCDQAPTG